MKKFITLHTLLLIASASVVAQERDSLAVDSLTINPAEVQVDTTQEEIEEPVIIVPWKEKKPASNVIFATDSLIRWQVWPGWGDFQAHRNNVISFRQGTAGRIDAYHINGYQPYEQQLKMEGISLNNPITGLPNYNLVPQRKISEAYEAFSGAYHSDIKLRDYYINRPISYLNYDESENDYRNLEFMVSRNFTQKTNLELSYWDRRDGEFYPNNVVRGNQIVGRVYHHLNDRFLLRAFYLRNQFQNNEPFGYFVDDPQTFSFDRYASAPISSNGESDFTRWDLAMGIYHRSDTSLTEDAGLEATLSKNQNELTFTGDTLGWDVRSMGLNAYKSLSLGTLNLRGDVSGKWHHAGESSIINLQNWNLLNTDFEAEFEPLSGVQLYGKAGYEGRSDEKAGHDIGGGLKVNLGTFSFHAGAFQFSRIPQIQAMYWNSQNYSGNADLTNETGLSITADTEFNLFNHFTIGASGRFKDAENAVFLSADSSFTNSGGFNQLAATVFASFNSALLEIESSATAQHFDYEDVSGPATALNNQDQIVWLRNSAFLKGYVFDRAAYLKIGVKTLLSPTFYSSRTYNTELGYWQGNSSYASIPPFFRLDGELSARVRAIMVVLRWENALDGLGQAGYFEAAGYPMPPRRLIVGIRAQFRN